MNTNKVLTNAVLIIQDALDKTCRVTCNPNGTQRHWNFDITDKWLRQMQTIRNNRGQKS